jgi:hypothetical protein
MMYDVAFHFFAEYMTKMLSWTYLLQLVAGVTTACVINAYHHYSCEFEPFS